MNGVGVKGFGITFNRKNGKPVQVLEGYVSVLRMAGMNITPSRDYIVISEDGVVYAYYEGRKNSMPHICKDMEGKKAEEFGIDMGLLR